MSGPFACLAGALNATFGAPVVVEPLDGLPRTIRAIFRDFPRIVEDPTGRQHDPRALSLQVRKSDSGGLGRGAVVRPSVRPGEAFKVVGAEPDGSPGDSFVILGLVAC